MLDIWCSHIYFRQVFSKNKARREQVAAGRCVVAERGLWEYVITAHIILQGLLFLRRKLVPMGLRSDQVELEQEGEENGQHGAKKFCGEWMSQKSRRSAAPCNDTHQAKTGGKNDLSAILQTRQAHDLERLSAANTAPPVVAGQKLKNKHRTVFHSPNSVTRGALGRVQVFCRSTAVRSRLPPIPPNNMIRELNELVHLVSKGCDRPDEHLRFLCKDKPEVMLLYRALRDHDFRTDAAAVKGAGIGELTSFKKYGKTLTEHLRHLVFFSNLPNNDYTRRRNDGFRAVATMKLAAHSGCKVVAHGVALDLLENGQKNDRPEWCMQATRSLIDAIATGLMDQKDFNRYVALYREYKEYVNWEHKANLYLDIVRFQLIRKKGFREALIREIDGYLEELAPMAGKVPSLLFNLHYYRLVDHKYLLTGQYI